MTALQSYIVPSFNGSENQFFTDHSELSAPADVSCLQGSGLTSEEMELISFFPAVISHLHSVCPDFCYQSAGCDSPPCDDLFFIEELFRYYRYLFLSLSIMQDHVGSDFSSFFPSLPKFALGPSHWDNYDDAEVCEPPLYFNCVFMFSEFMGLLLLCYGGAYCYYRSTGFIPSFASNFMTDLQKQREAQAKLAMQGGANDVAT